MKSRTLSSRFQSKVAVAFALYRNHPSSRVTVHRVAEPTPCRWRVGGSPAWPVCGSPCDIAGETTLPAPDESKRSRRRRRKKQIDCDELAGRFRKNKAEIESLRWQLDVVRRRVRPQAPSKALDIPARLVWSEFSW